MPKPLNPAFADLPVTIFSVMSDLANEHGAINLSQGFPDFPISDALIERVRPVHGVVDVDLFVPGCPPSADTIWYVLSELIEGRTPNPSQVTKFGA